MGNPHTNKKTNVAPDSELHDAARTGDLRTVQSICSSDPVAVNSRDKLSRTPLHLAAWSGHAEVVCYLCKSKADAGAAAMDDTAAIHFASQKGHTEVVRILLSFGASVKSANRKGMTPLHFAAQGSHLELAKYLIRKGANPRSKNKSGETPLDLVKSDEMRSLIDECEHTWKIEDRPTSGGKDVQDADDDRGKRKGEDANQGSSPDVQKKARVSIGHLVADDDLEEEEEEL